MALLYATIKGNRGPVSRMGTKSSGIRAAAQSWNGSVITELRYNDENKLMVNIQIAKGSCTAGRNVFYGTLEELERKLAQ